jgi:hypothetical protein
MQRRTGNRAQNLELRTYVRCPVAENHTANDMHSDFDRNLRLPRLAASRSKASHSLKFRLNFSAVHLVQTSLRLEKLLRPGVPTRVHSRSRRVRWNLMRSLVFNETLQQYVRAFLRTYVKLNPRYVRIWNNIRTYGCTSTRVYVCACFTQGNTRYRRLCKLQPET